MTTAPLATNTSTEQKSARKRAFSGIKPSGMLTLGNYLGALRQWVAMQQDYDNIFCAVDLHAITVYQEPDVLRAQTREAIALYLAAGIDAERSIVFVQSHVAAHAEIAWLLTCFAPLGWLNRMTQYKDKASKIEDQGTIGAGLLNYPTLMAGDILLYDTDVVPVGDDQRQHLEYTRDLAGRINHLYGQEIFVLPETIVPRAGARVMGLDEPTSKMSKSSDSEGHAIFLLDPPDRIKKKLMRAVTDSGRDIQFSTDPERAGVNNLLGIYAALTDKSNADAEADFHDARGYGDLKKAVVDVVNDALTPMQARYRELTEEPAYLDDILRDGAERAAAIAVPTLDRFRDAIGFVKPATSS